MCKSFVRTPAEAGTGENQSPVVLSNDDELAD
jgi:hypothetical protein